MSNAPYTKKDPTAYAVKVSDTLKIGSYTFDFSQWSPLPDVTAVHCDFKDERGREVFTVPLTVTKPSNDKLLVQFPTISTDEWRAGKVRFDVKLCFADGTAYTYIWGEINVALGVTHTVC